MKQLVLILLVVSTNSNSIAPDESKLNNIPVPIKEVEKSDIDYLVNAMIVIESSGDSMAYNYSTDAAGILQIRPIMVREVNRLLKDNNFDKIYSLDDRFNRTKSIDMFHIWRTLKHPDDDFEVLARCWNGGPQGYKSHLTIEYWNRVKNNFKN